MKHQIMVVGGGSAGIAVSATLLRKDKSLDVAIIEPADIHYYQPSFTLVGGGEFNPEDTHQPESKLIPKGAAWIHDAVESFDPERNSLKLMSGGHVEYDYLIVCPGIQLDWEKIDGLEETLGKNGVCSNYLLQTANYTWECIRTFKGGMALFTQPAMPIKCAGAPQKIMYMAADHFKKNNISAEINFNTTLPVMFGVPLFAEALLGVVARYGIKADFKSTLVAIDGKKKEAVFEVEDAAGNKNRVTKAFDMIHVTPPQSAPDFLKGSPISDALGWVDVDPGTLRHKKYPNIFGLGDATNTPNAKTAAAARLQAPLVARGLLAKIKNAPLPKAYDGYGACPLLTSKNSVMLAEFCYNGKVTPSFPLDPRKERYSYWLLKKFVFPFIYWKIMLKGIEFNVPHKDFE
ncbi:MAG: NAD(P)/FAD-dependent oxidoreductase [Methylococcales bacterium]